jgi:hypothetical protein
VRTRLALAAGAVVFLIVATANSGGYRYGISDQAFYVPAIAHAANPALFPRDTALLAPQMKLWAGDELLGFMLRILPVSLPGLFAVLYLAGILLLFSASVFLARGLGASWPAVVGATAFLTLRHRIAKTGANSLEGYMHPRMIAFALGLIAFGFLIRRKRAAAVCFVAIAAVVHPTTALWFAAAVAIGLVANRNILGRRVRGPKLLWTLLVLLIVPGVSSAVAGHRMDSILLSVLSEKDYLFPHQWPAYAWALNLLYPVVLWLIYLRRRTLGVTAPGEWYLVAGLTGLVGLFLYSVPLAAHQIATVVQLQVNRVFWLLDAATAFYVAWWLIDDLAGRRKAGAAVAAALVVLACGRGVFILHDTGRALVQIDLPDDDWTRAMGWIRTQPIDWQVVADPGHASKYGTSVRVAALRDTVLERSKDSAMAMYDPQIAYRVSDRIVALWNFGGLVGSEFRRIGSRYDAQIVVIERPRELDLPRLYENDRFVIYDLR